MNRRKILAISAAAALILALAGASLAGMSTRLITRSIQNIVKKHVVASGINPEGLSSHKLRHTVATLMYKDGRVNIRSLQQILGHESIATTAIYTHVNDSQLQAAVNSNPLAMMFS